MVRERGLSPETRSMHCTDYASRSFDTCFFTLTSKKGLETVTSDFQTVCCHADAYLSVFSPNQGWHTSRRKGSLSACLYHNCPIAKQRFLFFMDDGPGAAVAINSLALYNCINLAQSMTVSLETPADLLFFPIGWTNFYSQMYIGLFIGFPGIWGEHRV